MKLNKTQILPLVFVLVLVMLIPVAVFLSQKQQETRSKASNLRIVTLSLYPDSQTFNLGDTKTFDIIATLSSGSSSEKIDFLKTEVDFDKNYIQIPPGADVDTSVSGLDRIIKVDSPAVANDQGKIVIALGAITSGGGPSTDKPITIAKITFKAMAATAGKSITINNTASQVVNNSSATITVLSTPANYVILPANSDTPTPTPIISASATPVLSLTPSPISSPSACITLPFYDNFPDFGPDGTKWDSWSDGNGTISTAYNALSVAAGPPFTSSHTGLISKRKVCGDFDTSVDVSQFSAVTGNWSAATLSVEQMDTDSAIMIELSKNNSKQYFWTEYRSNGVTQQNTTKFADTVTTAAKLRIRRMGSVFSVFYDQKDGKGWQLLNTYSDGFSTNANILFGVGAWSPDHPSVSANFANFSLTQAIADPSPTCSPRPACLDSNPICLPPEPVSGWCPPPITPMLSPIPTPPSGADKYTIDPGIKQSLSINIGAAVNPLIRFKAKLGSVRSTPDLYFRLRVRDEAAAVKNPTQSVTDACTNPPPSDHDYYIPVHATGGVYNAVSQNSSTVPQAPGATTAAVSADGWVTLDGILPGKYYTLYLKGPKTRKSRMAQHVLLQPGQVSAQDYDWTGVPLDPGDLPDPNNAGKQDCVINATDWSLLQSRIGSTDAAALSVCDVNYDGICNAGDSVAILNTLSTRPDDDQ